MKEIVDRMLEKYDIHVNGTRPADIHIHEDKTYSEILLHRSLGAGESYMNGWWDCDRLDEFFYHLFRNNFSCPTSKGFKELCADILHKLVNYQTHYRSTKVAKVHYNLGNTLYQYMLGPTMAYTCAYWQNARDLDEAQRDKFELICRKISLRENECILDLGCGFGGLAKYMAENYGCKVVAVNISSQQVKYARSICENLPVEIFECDYRDKNTYNRPGKKFDKVVSVGLCEHVGYKNYRAYFDIVNLQLAEEGIFLLHTIGNNITKNVTDPWIDKYIFPNSLIPSLKQLTSALEGLFIVEDLHNFGSDYDKTLMAWYDNFAKNWDLIKGDYDERFYRMWKYYLLSCAAAFRSRTLQLWQFVLSPKGVLGGYTSVR